MLSFKILGLCFLGLGMIASSGAAPPTRSC